MKVVVPQRTKPLEMDTLTGEETGEGLDGDDDGVCPWWQNRKHDQYIIKLLCCTQKVYWAVLGRMPF